MSASVKKVVTQITLEIEQIDRLFSVYAGLLQPGQQLSPNEVELAALGSILHSFYNGLENIFLAVAKRIDRQVPADTQWHKDLLTQISRATDNRTAVISEELAQKLAKYMGFRHFYRHTYAFFLDWNEVEKLTTPLPEIWIQTKEELFLFIENISSQK